MVNELRSISEYTAFIKFIKNHIVTNNYKKTGQLVYHMCHLVRVVTVNESMKCHLDMGTYGKDSNLKLV